MAEESLISLLGELRDITEPAPVSMWPETPAWAVLGLLTALGLAFGLRAFLRHRAATAYRRAAQAELAGLSAALGAGSAPALARLDILLRRTALTAFPRAEVAALTGSEWIGFLDRTGGAFAPHADAMLAAPYAPRPPRFDGPGVRAAARDWIRHHHA